MGVADMVRKIEIYQEKPWDASIKLDGVNVADSVRGVNVRLHASELPKVELDLAIIDVSMDLQHPQILIPAATRHLLIELGWTPPSPPYRVNLIKGGPAPWD
jgi:hypothetical protein